MDSEEQKNNSKPWLFQPGQSGNPGGRPKGSKSLKTYVQEYLRDLNDEEKLEFIKGLPKDVIWKMGEGNPKQDTELHGNLTISDVLDSLENNGHTPEGQELED